MKLAAQLQRWLDAGRNHLGEIQIDRRDSPGFPFELHHYLDDPRAALAEFHQPEDAIEIGKMDNAGRYRPLRSAPTLKRGWRLSLFSLDDVVRALDFFYPAMLGTASAFEKNQGRPVPLRDTLNRQTGMYRITAKITHPQADALIGRVCPPEKCLKTITWEIEPGMSISALPSVKTDLSQSALHARGSFIPMPCEECCNILVAAARETVKNPPE